MSPLMETSCELAWCAAASNHPFLMKAPQAVRLRLNIQLDVDEVSTRFEMSLCIRLLARLRLRQSEGPETPSSPHYDHHAMRRTAQSPRKTISRRPTSAANARQGG